MPPSLLGPVWSGPFARSRACATDSPWHRNTRRFAVGHLSLCPSSGGGLARCNVHVRTPRRVTADGAEATSVPAGEGTARPGIGGTRTCGMTRSGILVVDREWWSGWGECQGALLTREVRTRLALRLAYCHLLLVARIRTSEYSWGWCENIAHRKLVELKVMQECRAC